MFITQINQSRIKNEIQQRTSIDHSLYFKKQNIERNISNTYTGMKECIQKEIKLISSVIILAYNA